MTNRKPRFAVVVDAQRDFMLPGGALYVAGAEACIPKIESALAALDPADVVGVLITQDTHDPDTYPASEEARQFPPHCLRGTEGWKLAVGLPTQLPVLSLEKGVFGMWEEPHVQVGPTGWSVPRDHFFDALRLGGVEEIVLMGVASDYCVRFALEGLVERGFRVTVPPGTTRGIAAGIEAVAAEIRAKRPGAEIEVY
jgi:nicotinamidase/pyrazinamidase